jgi:bifunctional non-homologous end joining protein LigD
VELYSRNGNSFNASYPIAINELKKIKQQVILDGEIVVLDEKGKSDFQQLQQYENNSESILCYYVFDILAVDGKNINHLSLLERKKILKTVIKKSTVIKYSDHVLENGIALFKAAQAQGLEGIMAKKAHSEYYPSIRTANWLKIKHHKSEDVIIVGFTQPNGARKYFGSLVLALKTKDGFKYIGHTGSGFNETTLKKTFDKLKPLITKKSPFKEIITTNAPVTWVKPKYIAEIKFTEWTNEGSMRHPIFLRMRDDKFIKDM